MPYTWTISNPSIDGELGDEAVRYMNSSYTVDVDLKKKRLDVWVMSDGTEISIVDMTVSQLEKMLTYCEKGYRCYGQRHKMFTLKRVLEDKLNAK